MGSLSAAAQQRAHIIFWSRQAILQEKRRLAVACEAYVEQGGSQDDFERGLSRDERWLFGRRHKLHWTQKQKAKLARKIDRSLTVDQLMHAWRSWKDWRKAHKKGPARVRQRRSAMGSAPSRPAGARGRGGRRTSAGATSLTPSDEADFYFVVGTSPRASPRMISRACVRDRRGADRLAPSRAHAEHAARWRSTRRFRQRALQLHPDRPTGSKRAFQALQEAYEVLSCPVKRAAYDADYSASYFAARRAGNAE